MSRTSTIAARCAALSGSIGQVIPDVASFARKARDTRHDLNALIQDLVIIKTGLGITQDDCSASKPKLPTPLIDALAQILDSCDYSSERLHKGFLKLSCSSRPKVDWQTFKDGPLTSIRHDLEASKMVLELAIDYLALYEQPADLESLLDQHSTDHNTAMDELLKRTDTEEIEVNLVARDRLPSLLHAIRLLRSCLKTSVSREGKSGGPSGAVPRTTTPRPDSLDPSLGESRRSLRESPSAANIVPSSNASTPSLESKGITTWLADIATQEDAQKLRHSRIVEITNSRKHSRQASERVSRTDITPGQAAFIPVDSSGRSSRTLIIPELRLKKVKSWSSGITLQYATHSSSSKSRSPSNSKPPSNYAPTVASSNVSVFHKKLTSDKIAVAKSNRKNMEPSQRAAVDRILANIPADATAAEVERILWEGANPMMSDQHFDYFFIRAAHEMSPDILRVLMEFGADITKRSPGLNKYHTAMHAAALGKQVDTIKYLVSLGHSIDVTNDKGETPLLLAIKTPGAYKVAKFLAEKGADINHKSKDGETPLVIALTTKKLEGGERSRMIELLLSHGAVGEVTKEMELRRGDSKGRMVLGLT